MRLAQKFTLILVSVVFLVLVVMAYLDVQRAVSHYEREARTSQSVLAEVLSTAVVDMWHKRGWSQTLAFLDQVEAKQIQNGTRIRWVWLEGDSLREYWPTIPVEELRPLIDGEQEFVVDRRNRGKLRVYLYKPVSLKDLPLGALEISRSTENEKAYIEGIVRNAILKTALVFLIYGLIASVLGRWIITEPIQALIEQARRVGEGHFTIPTNISQRDEIGELALEMNFMSERLEAARTRAEQERAARLEVEAQLSHADRLASVGKLSASVIHDLGTPLAVISGRAMMIANGDVSPEDVPEDAKTIARQADRIAAMIRQLLNFSRRGRSGLEKCELVDIVEETISLIEPVAKKCRVKIERDAPTDKLATVAMPGQLRQVLNNLIMNAIQAMPKGGTVTVGAGTHDAASLPPAPGHSARPDGVPNYHYIYVKDEGNGIKEEDMERIFEPFYTTKEEGEGTGLGLSVCQSIAKRHQGWMTVVSEVGVGSCFTLYLPAKEAKA